MWSSPITCLIFVHFWYDRKNKRKTNQLKTSSRKICTIHTYSRASESKKPFESPFRHNFWYYSFKNWEVTVKHQKSRLLSRWIVFWNSEVFHYCYDVNDLFGLSDFVLLWWIFQFLRLRQRKRSLLHFTFVVLLCCCFSGFSKVAVIVSFCTPV